MAIISNHHSVSTHESRQTPQGVAKSVLGPRVDSTPSHNRRTPTGQAARHRSTAPPHLEHHAAGQDEATGLPAAGPPQKRVLTDPKEIRAVETAHVHGFQEGYEKLSNEDRARFDKLVARFTPEKVETGGYGIGMGFAKPTPEQLEQGRMSGARHGLYQLVGQGKLMETDAGGRSILDHLERLESQELGPGMDRTQVFQTTVSSLTFPAFADGDRTAASLQDTMRERKPAELARQMTDLAGADGVTQVRPGVEVKRSGNSSDMAEIYREAIKPVAAGEIREAELGSSPERRQAYENLTPEQKASFDRLIETQIPRGEMPKLNFQEATPEERKAHSEERGRQFREDSQALETRNQLYQTLESGAKATTTSGWEGKLRDFQRKSDYQVPHGHQHGVPASENERNMNLPSNARRAALIGELTRNGGTRTVRNSEGRSLEVTISGRGTDYKMQLDKGEPVSVEFPRSFSTEQKAEALEKLTDYYSQIPEHLRGFSPKIEFHDHPAPKRWNGKRPAATFEAGRIQDNKINFYDGLNHLTEHIFNHEYGHAVGYEVERAQDGAIEGALGWAFPIFDSEAGAPEGWRAAMKADPASMSEYSNKNWKEDFAESFSAYMEAREYGPDVVQSSITARFPNRAKILEQVFTPPS